MEKNYRERLAGSLPFQGDDLEKLLANFVFREIPARTILLAEGEIATKMFRVITGCLRTYLIKDNGTEITSQFFLENQMVSSFESSITKAPSRQYIETIEDSIIAQIPMKRIRELITGSEAIREYFNNFIILRLIYYMNQHASFVLDNPEKRYIKLARENPELLARLPQQYIASYLGITPVSLSRIKNRIKLN